MEPYTEAELAEIAANIRKFAAEGEIEIFVGGYMEPARFRLPRTEYRKTWLEIMALDMETQPTDIENTEIQTRQWRIE